jgi:hypothetical protein
MNHIEICSNEVFLNHLKPLDMEIWFCWGYQEGEEISDIDMFEIWD